MLKHFNLRVHGRVQGVFFRDFIKQKADELGLSGFVRNEQDGTVYLEAEGEEKALQKFAEICKTGADHAKVEKVDTEEGELKNFEDFIIKS